MNHPIVTVPGSENAYDAKDVTDFLTRAGWRHTVVQPGGVIVPSQKTVEAIARLVGGPADGNLVEHVRAVVDGAARTLKERDAARLNYLDAQKTRDAALLKLKAWEDRFDALVGASTPDIAGNEVIRLRATLEQMQRDVAVMQGP